MQLNPECIATREKLILAGLFLSKYDAAGLKRLGFESFLEAFNVIGYALGAKPASIKNYRAEFDPLFPNRRKGWHKRPTREYCLKVYKEYKGLDFDAFTGLVELPELNNDFDMLHVEFLFRAKGFTPLEGLVN